jgi:stage IV sporulation protein B
VGIAFLCCSAGLGCSDWQYFRYFHRGNRQNMQKVTPPDNAPVIARERRDSMYETIQKTKRRRRAAAAAVLSLLFLLFCAGTTYAVPPEETVRQLIPVGRTVGVKLFARGVLVVKPPESGTPAAESGLQKGDIILKCNGSAVTSTEQFQQMLQTGDAVELQVRENSALRTVQVTPDATEEGAYAIGAWIRDSMAGIGTVTFLDPVTGVFGALGHGVTDPDTAQLMPFSSGSVLPSTVKAVKRGAVGSAGELRGDFDLMTELGELNANTDCGIFGTLSADVLPDESVGKPVPVAKSSEVRTGKATILANVSGGEVEEYDVEISRIFQDNTDPRDMLVKVTDEDLLETTGGIVQGMSGSPILQNGKLVGAVTHVLLNDPTTGYGIFIETMLKTGDAA